MKKIFKRRLLRFGLVGIVNTLVNFGVLNLMFFGLGSGKIMANVVATAVAVVVSFALNRSFVFGGAGRWHSQIVPFAIVSAIGSFVINNLAYAASLAVLSRYVSHSVALLGFSVSASFIHINTSAVVGTLAGLTWNYNGYRMIFDRVGHGGTDEQN